MQLALPRPSPGPTAPLRRPPQSWLGLTYPTSHLAMRRLLGSRSPPPGELPRRTGRPPHHARQASTPVSRERLLTLLRRAEPGPFPAGRLPTPPPLPHVPHDPPSSVALHRVPARCRALVSRAKDPPPGIASRCRGLRPPDARSCVKQVARRGSCTRPTGHRTASTAVPSAYFPLDASRGVVSRSRSRAPCFRCY